MSATKSAQPTRVHPGLSRDISASDILDTKRTYIQAYRQTHIYSQTDRQTERHTDRQTDGRTDGQTDGH